MTENRRIRRILRSQPTVEGAGVRLKRVFGFNHVPLFDPFLLLDDFRSDNPEDFVKGFPWHPHRGIETITYVVGGDVEHGDSMGNRGIISTGDVQWMTAGSGIIHEEMPKGDANGVMLGFQLWANLPGSQKMMEPRYRDVKREQIPEVVLPEGTRVRVICGRVDDAIGPVRDIIIEPEYLDITVPPQTRFIHSTQRGHTVFAYVIEGKGFFSRDENSFMTNEALVLFHDGAGIQVSTEEDGVRFLLVSGRPLNEPVAWYGPIVMNTEEELRVAFEEYRNGTFIRHGPA
ncbi:MAG: pirin family protein [Desulfatiglandaceae bacterium]